MHTEKYSVDKFERRQHEMVDHQNVSTNNWISKAYDNRKIRQRLIKGDNSFDDIRSTQNTKGMNANLNHYVSRRLRMIVFIKQMCYILGDKLFQETQNQSKNRKQINKINEIRKYHNDQASMFERKTNTLLLLKLPKVRSPFHKED